MMKLIRCAALVATLAPALAGAQDFDAGQRAFEADDYATALREWRPLAEKGEAEAQRSLGWMYRLGLGVAQDHSEAVRWYRQAAEKGHADAQRSLGLMYLAGLGVPQDYAEAMRWFRIAAEQGHAVAQRSIGVFYHDGVGVAQDYVTAHMWYNIAGANGDEEARIKRDLIVNEMTADTIAEAQRRARVCMESGYQDCD